MAELRVVTRDFQ